MKHDLEKSCTICNRLIPSVFGWRITASFAKGGSFHASFNHVYSITCIKPFINSYFGKEIFLKKIKTSNLNTTDDWWKNDFD